MSEKGRNGEKAVPIVIVGGGASGIMAAIRGTELIPGGVLLIERGARVGKKLLATGNGRCNISNRNAGIDHYHGENPEFILPAFSHWPVEKVEERFSEMGLLFTEEENGKLYPMSLQAAAAVDVLRLEMERLGVDILTETELIGIRREKKSFQLTLRTPEGEREILARTVILACGGEASPGLGGYTGGYRILKSLGIPVTERMPAIVQLKADMNGLKGLSGSKFQTILTLTDGTGVCRKEEGELLFTDYGISGPPVLQLSGTAVRLIKKGKTPVVKVDFLPGFSYQKVLEALHLRKELRSEKRLEDYFTGFIPKRLGQCILKTAGIAPLSREAASLTREEIRAAASLLKAFPVKITGDNGMKNAQVTQGGAKTAAFYPETMEARSIPGLFVTGELYDIDGDCGGYNLQWAWSSGLLAAESAAALVQKSIRK